MMEKVTIYKVAIIAVGVLIVVFSGRSTLILIGKYFQLSESLEVFSPGAESASSVGIEFGGEKVDLDKYSFELFSKLAASHGIVIRNMDPAFGFTESSLLILTKEIVFQGGFIDVIRCLKEAGSELHGIKISSIHFFIDEKDRQKKLYAKVYLQSAASAF